MVRRNAVWREHQVVLAICVSLVACYVPARRAATISPAELLRNT